MTVPQLPKLGILSRFSSSVQDVIHHIGLMNRSFKLELIEVDANQKAFEKDSKSFYISFILSFNEMKSMPLSNNLLRAFCNLIVSL